MMKHNRKARLLQEEISKLRSAVADLFSAVVSSNKNQVKQKAPVRELSSLHMNMTQCNLKNVSYGIATYIDIDSANLVDVESTKETLAELLQKAHDACAQVGVPIIFEYAVCTEEESNNY